MARKLSPELLDALKRFVQPAYPSDGLKMAIKVEIIDPPKSEQVDQALINQVGQFAHRLHETGDGRVLAIQMNVILDDGSTMHISSLLGLEA